MADLAVACRAPHCLQWAHVAYLFPPRLHVRLPSPSTCWHAAGSARRPSSSTMVSINFALLPRELLKLMLLIFARSCFTVISSKSWMDEMSETSLPGVLGAADATEEGTAAAAELAAAHVDDVTVVFLVSRFGIEREDAAAEDADAVVVVSAATGTEAVAAEEAEP